jgi:hypothetical protein
MKNIFELSVKDNQFEWYTWSKEFRAKLILISNELNKLNTETINLFPNEIYGFTYRVNNKKLSTETESVIYEIIKELINLNPQSGLILFNNLIFDSFSSNSLHVLFALISEEMRIKYNIDSRHSPIVEKESDNGFPVHADLFKTKAIFNVISEVEENKHGEVLLLSINSLKESMNQVNIMPNHIKKRILNVLTHRIDNDMFDEIYDLMYGEHEWTSKLKNEIKKREIIFSLKQGMGYFAIDGEWLHGRNAYVGDILEKRLNRLLFNTEYTDKIPICTFKELNTKTNLSKKKSAKSKSLNHELVA